MIAANVALNYQDIVKGVGAGLSLLDKNFHILWVNKHQAEWFGVPQEICGKHCYKIFEHREHVCRGCPTLKVFKTGEVHTAHRIGITQDGLTRHYQLTVSPIKDNQGKVVFALELVQDITDKVFLEKRQSKAMKKLKQMYQHLTLINAKLHQNIKKLRKISGKMEHIKSSLQKRYRRRMSEYMVIKEELQDIFKLNRTLSSRINLKNISSMITRSSSHLVRAEACILRLVGDERTLAVNASFGIKASILRNLSVLKFGESLCGRAAREKRSIVVNHISGNKEFLHLKEWEKHGFNSVLCVPVLFHRSVLGTITLFSRKPGHFTETEVDVLKIFASQIAVAVHEAQNYTAIHKNYFDTIHALVLALEARDYYTRGHTERVTKYALELGRALGFSEKELEILRYASEVHDVGKIGIPDSILNKPGKLTPEERAVVELHPVKGAEVLEPLEFLKSAIPIVRHHHERYDGTGYPDGLEKDKIPVMAKIIACADSFDAMTSERPYRSNKMSAEEALFEIKNNSGSQFDPGLAELFIKIIRSKIPA